jgi:hypothetical protein
VGNGECWIICTTMNINKHPQIWKNFWEKW